MQKILAVVILVGTLALSASAAMADDSVNGFSDKLQNGGVSAVAPAQSVSPTVDDPPAIKKYTDYREDNMVH